VGVDATLRALDRAGPHHTGSWARPPAGRPALLVAHGITVGIVAATESTNGIAAPHPWSVALADAGAILAAARRARRVGARAVVVNMHWGAEYRHWPTPSQWRLARALTGSPAVTAVVGQHAHVVQPVRFLNGKPVVFGEGNLVSNQSGASQDGMIAFLDLVVTPRAARARRVRYLPTYVRRPDYVVVPATGSSRRRTIGIVGRGVRVRPMRGA
jgi:poly-gamma-glutamate capsule biosynthesis protein CapA/YwtB (metallophosphatase superfamily)